MRAELLERFASISGFGNHSHVRFNRNKPGNSLPDEPVIIDGEDPDRNLVAAHDLRCPRTAENVRASQKRRALRALR